MALSWKTGLKINRENGKDDRRIYGQEEETVNEDVYRGCTAHPSWTLILRGRLRSRRNCIRGHCTCGNGYAVWDQMMGLRAITEVVEWYNAQWVESCESLTYT